MRKYFVSLKPITSGREPGFPSAEYVVAYIGQTLCVDPSRAFASSKKYLLFFRYHLLHAASGSRPHILTSDRHTILKLNNGHCSLLRSMPARTKEYAWHSTYDAPGGRSYLCGHTHRPVPIAPMYRYISSVLVKNGKKIKSREQFS